MALNCAFRAGKGFVALARRLLVERSFAWLLGCRRLSRCYTNYAGKLYEDKRDRKPPPLGLKGVGFFIGCAR